MGRLAPFILTFRVFFVVSLFLKGAESCKTGWTFYKGHCYGLFNDKVTWAEAEIECHKMGGHLASIHFIEEMAHLSQYIKRNLRGENNVWIGMQISKSNKNWEWVDRTSVRYLPWDDGEPNNYFFNEDCVELVRKRGYSGEYENCLIPDYIRWNDKKCSKHQPYLCKTLAI